MQGAYWCPRAAEQGCGAARGAERKHLPRAAGGECTWQAREPRREMHSAFWACCLLSLPESTSDVGEGWVQQCRCGALPSCCPVPSAPCAPSRRGVTCGPCMSKNAGMWIPAYLWGETCPSTRVVGVCSASR